MRHLSIELYPRESGLSPHRVRFTRPESQPLRSMLEEGVIYRHPEREEEAIIWSGNEASIRDVLRYHYGQDWSPPQNFAFDTGTMKAAFPHFNTPPPA